MSTQLPWALAQTLEPHKADRQGPVAKELANFAQKGEYTAILTLIRDELRGLREQNVQVKHEHPAMEGKKDIFKEIEFQHAIERVLWLTQVLHPAKN